MSDDNNTKTRPTTIASKQSRDNPNDPKQGDPVDVNSNLTPITRRQVDDVFANHWKDMSIGQLQQQLDVMEQRLLYAQQLGKEEIYKQVLAGVNHLKAIIIEKTPDEIKLL